MSEHQTEKHSALRDSSGNWSSKRIAGMVMISVGALYLLIVGGISISTVVADSSTALDVGRVLIYTGGALLGVGVAEKFGSARK